MSGVELVIFDMAGTTVRDDGQVPEAFTAALAEYGVAVGPEAIRALIETSRDAGLMVTFEQTGTARMVSPEIETVLYRATQESLTNIRKHAHASAANVRLAYEADAVSLRVRDNGRGRKGGEDNVGLSALRERATALNGMVLAENHLEGGFVLEVTLPLEHAV